VRTPEDAVEYYLARGRTLEQICTIAAGRQDEKLKAYAMERIAKKKEKKRGQS